MNLVVINGGKERASYSVAFEGHLNAEAGPVAISKRSIEVLKQIADLGKQFGGMSDKLETTLTERLKGFPSGEDIVTYLENEGMSVLDYIENSSKVLAAVGKTAGTTGERAKRGEGHNTKANKFLNSVVSKLVCRLAPASTNGKITDEMLEEGYTKALATLQEVDKTDILTAARKIAEKTGVDINGYIRLRSENAKDEEADSE